MSDLLVHIPISISQHYDLIFVSIIGGLILSLLKIAAHFSRNESDKLKPMKYLGFFVFVIFGLPILGGVVTSIYLMNGDKISPILAFQIGLTSPAIVQSLIIAVANNMAKNSSPALLPEQ
ncbi:hypothetical protein VC885_25535 [Citrobacter freundii]|uniref:hypothetical protein n=1 Tax=Citrobacter freundii TaxID=546 RepID=UPI00214DB258|nr:hypothetical protein [Citrobacter freundii]MCR3688996.1 hypothetical protein [Citrobacter freundii]MDE8815029.1 hypothetical protein [Citrobacter freundii]MDV2277332.1 hypothetical protein [Citrobacter freundii]MEB0857524.1 hypothetical protein [Citrobacter freundii]HCL6888652.1 hypothetical protein [Citrobacter freundii]